MQPTLCEATVLIAAGRLYQPARLAVSTMPTPTSRPIPTILNIHHTCPAARSVRLIPTRPCPTSHSQLQARTARRRASYGSSFLLSVCLS
jgi:hypothetical protein